MHTACLGKLGIAYNKYVERKLPCCSVLLIPDRLQVLVQTTGAMQSPLCWYVAWHVVGWMSFVACRPLHGLLPSRAGVFLPSVAPGRPGTHKLRLVAFARLNIRRGRHG